MANLLSFIIATLVTVPIIGYIISFIIAKQITKNHSMSVRISVDISTVLFIVSVHFLIHAIWGISMIWAILLVLIMVALAVVLVHYKVKEEIVMTKVMRGFWKLNFIIFSSAYVILLIYGLVKRVTMTI
ncbi:DUF3397 domain-containing protein [Peribacillus acanthi]|uniref:DUF3397 domain-containing protein n=1 Tax=Peribacillus acanthi TaxID=2171554 RepID=UPI000D3E5B59|nr:DUF3397 domain-containing protein [Peribacillus acanthi]